jgi:hypothetical protein
MATQAVIPVSHYDGHRNLTQAQKEGDGPTLAEQQALIRADQVASEAAETALGTAPTLTPGAEAGDVIAVAFASPVASVEQYIAEILDANTEVNDAAFSVAETGVGAEVSPTGKARLIFTTDAAGAAELSVTDVVGASASTVYVTVRPLFASADVAQQCAPVVVAITFD